MSGGHFDYKQHHIEDIAADIENVFDSTWGFSDATLDELRHGVAILRRAAIYAQRIDWLLSGDDGEESFHRCLAEDLGEQTPRVFDEALQAENDQLRAERDYWRENAGLHQIASAAYKNSAARAATLTVLKARIAELEAKLG